MATAKQIAANRRNAMRSTGPRTVAGKMRSSENALKHGLSRLKASDCANEALEFIEKFGVCNDDLEAKNVSDVLNLACATSLIAKIRKAQTQIFRANNLESDQSLALLNATDRYLRRATSAKKRAVANFEKRIARE